MVTTVTRYQPLAGSFDSLLDELFRPARAWSNGDYEPLPIRLDVKETAQAYAVHAELPGVKKQDIAIEINGNEVSLSAETRREADASEGEKWLRVERYVGKTARKFVLPVEVDEALAEAKFADGVLELTLPKKASVMPRKVEIK
jgi:HSP20 family protein